MPRSRLTRHASAPTWPGVSSPKSSDSAYAPRCQRRDLRLSEIACQRRGQRTYLPTIHGTSPATTGQGENCGSRGIVARGTAMETVTAVSAITAVRIRPVPTGIRRFLPGFAHGHPSTHAPDNVTGDSADWRVERMTRR